MIPRSVFKMSPLFVAVISVFLSSQTSFAQAKVTGIVRAKEQVIIKSELAGVVRHIAVKEGDFVKEGQLLFELDNDHQKINLDLSQAGLNKAKAAVEESQVLLSNAERETARLKLAGTAVPRKELEDIQDQVLRVKASLAAQVAELARAEQDVKLREQDLKDTQTLAPFNATVTEIFVNRGESLRPIDTQVMELVDLDTLYAELRLPSNYLRSVQLDKTIKVQVEGEWMGRTGQVDGKVTYINPTIDAASRTFKIKIGIPGRGVVRPGMLVEAQFILVP
jgi:RND family efflux transporter MFP subunit